jgi:orotate phosphoribosyltransferase
VTAQENQVLDLFERTGAYLTGHFRLSSGLHSASYLQSALVLRYPEYAERQRTGAASCDADR